MSKPPSAPSRRSLRSNKPSSEAEGKDRLLLIQNIPPEPIPKSPREPADTPRLNPLMGPPPPPPPPPPPRKKENSTSSGSEEEEEEEEDEIDVSPESSLLPAFKEVTCYSDGARKVCFVNFDRHPGVKLAQSGLRVGSELRLGDEVVCGEGGA